MQSESEVVWIRVRNNVANVTRVSDWHAIVPGLASDGPPPGVACGTALTGSRQSISNTGLKTIDGPKHALCLELVAAFISSLPSAAAPYQTEEEPPVLAPPG